MSADGPRSRVLSLVFTDLAGSTALKVERGDVAGGALIARHRDLVGRLAREHAGRVVDFAGDGAFLAFEAPSAAAQFALALQAAHAADPELPAVRVGIHLGEVSEREGRVEGLAVDLAARVQSLARPGQVLLSAAAAGSARQRTAHELSGHSVRWQSHGAYALKGAGESLEIYEAGLEGVAPFAAPLAGEKARPTRRAIPRSAALCALLLAFAGGAWWLRAHDTSVPTPTLGAAPALAPIRSLAVLPLTNLSGDPEQEYFADGMTETLIAELAKLPGVRVISRTSVMQFKGARTPLPEIARLLNVDGVIEGSVMRAGDEVRITAQLIDARRDEHVWAEQYDRELARVLEIQSEVARAVAQQIALALTPQQAAHLKPPKAVDPRAQDAYFRGLAQRALVSDPENLRRSIAAFEDAIAITPDYAPAFAGLATSRCFLWIVDGAPLVVEARQAALRAVELDDSLGDAHIALARILFLHDFAWTAAEHEFRRGIELGASDPLNLSSLAFLLLATGRRDEAFTWMDEVVASAPFDFFVRTERAFLLVQGGRPEAAIEETNRILSINPEYAGAVWLRVLANEQLGRFDEAIRDWQRLAELVPGRAELTAEAERAWRSEGRAGYWRAAALDPLRDNFLRAAALTQGAAFEDAFAALERAYQARDARIGFLRVYEPFSPLRSDPRYSELLRRMNLLVPEP